MAKDRDQAPVDSLSFEDALKELEQIVHRLETGEAPLEESLAIYERGAKLRTHCEEKLKAAQLRVDKIVLQRDGQPRTEPFDAE